MDRRHFMKKAMIAGAGLAASTNRLAARNGADDEAPNVVMLISDDQAYTDFGFMGHDTIRTPHIDRLAEESLCYTRGYVTTALCSPSLATMITGLYPHQHRVTGNDPVRNGSRGAGPGKRLKKHFANCPRVPAMLQKKNYLSFQSGKWWLDPYSLAGFTHGMTEGGRHGGKGLDIGREGLEPALDFMDMARDAGDPFYLWYAPFLPHRPHNPPQELLEKYSDAGPRKEYYAMCEWFDRTCGQILDYLDETGEAENTIVLFVADNGWPHRADWDSRPGKGGKGSPWELGVRTPIMVRWPGRVQPTIDTQTLASNIDLAPTVLEACGLQPTENMHGRNLMNRSRMKDRDAIFLENFTHDMADVDDPAASLRCRTCIRGFWKLILWEEELPDVRRSGPPKGDADVELYNLAEDPLETTNLASDHPEKVKQLTKLINDWWNPHAD